MVKYIIVRNRKKMRTISYLYNLIDKHEFAKILEEQYER